MKQKTKSFKCPNCGHKMQLPKENILVSYEGDRYDKWVCADCPILVFDWRSE